MSIRKVIREVEVMSCDECLSESTTGGWYVDRVGKVAIVRCSNCYWTPARHRELATDLNTRAKRRGLRSVNP